jgi:hypothetical protein
MVKLEAELEYGCIAKESYKIFQNINFIHSNKRIG